MEKTALLAFRLFYGLCLLFAALLPVGGKVNNLVLILLLATWLLHTWATKSWHLISWRSEFWLAAGLFFIFVVGLLHTENLRQGFRDVEHKLALLAFPLIFLSQKILSTRQVASICRVFAYACLAVAVYILSLSFWHYGQTQDATHLFYHQLAAPVRMHAIMLSAYFALAIFRLLQDFLNPGNTHRLQKAGQLSGCLVLLTGLVLLSSKTILFAFLVILFLGMVVYFSRKQKAFTGFLAAVAVAVSLVLAILLVPNLRQRVEEIAHSKLQVLEMERFEYDTEFSGLTIRLLFWKYALTLLERDQAWLWGVGTGDSQDQLNAIYREHNLYSGNGTPQDVGYQEYDTHNQFMETFLKLGLLGLAYLLFYVSRNLFLSFQKRHYLFAAFLLLFIIFSVTETTLQANKGIFFFAFFNCLFLLQIQQETEDKETAKKSRH
ncbi:O-antigen ligase family protein [Rufibacter sp. LB8]|uniref:O-antigen ligase family protein n=1 Tax=Rufibacter sp. LB8 TaxID=2777781 RepID=UPI00178C1CD2|nr:O-antigen ligase family protein [Rufibacter sp. LB8]